MIIDREIATALGLDRSFEIELRVEGRRLVVEPVQLIVGAGENGTGRGVAQRDHVRGKRKSA